MVIRDISPTISGWLLVYVLRVLTFFNVLETSSFDVVLRLLSYLAIVTVYSAAVLPADGGRGQRHGRDGHRGHVGHGDGRRQPG